VLISKSNEIHKVKVKRQKRIPYRILVGKSAGKSLLQEIDVNGRKPFK
jgi:hypothetical protein